MKFKIGEFSKIAKVPVRTLRYYDDEGLLIPGYTDPWNGYRYYYPEQLSDIRKIVLMREAGLSIKEISDIISGRMTLSSAVDAHRNDLQRMMDLIDELQERIDMTEKEIEIRTIPGGIVEYRKGRIDSYACLTGFVFGFQKLAMELNPDVECTEDDYCFIVYDDPEYRETDIGLKYAQKVKKKGMSKGEIGFDEIREVEAVCVKHKGPYSLLNTAYEAAVEYLRSNGLEPIEPPRECYIDGCWNRDDEKDYLTEIQFPIRYV